MSTDPFEQFKAAQKQGWAHFVALEISTTMPAAELANHAGLREADSKGRRVLDVACGTGVFAVTAARRGAKVAGLDMTPELLDRARYNSATAGVTIDWHEGDAEALPFENATFDVVASQFGHIFAPRPAIAIAEMLRVLKPGGTIAFSTWPPDLFMGKMFALRERYLPSPPGVPSPVEWGDRETIKQRLGDAVSDVAFASGAMLTPALSPQHQRIAAERTSGSLIKLVETLGTSDPAKLADFRSEYEALAAEYLHNNGMELVFLMTRATKK